jgi:DNA-binding transcriptional regulator YiaG
MLAHMSASEILNLIGLLGWSVTRFAAELHVSELTVRRWLNGQRAPRPTAVFLMGRLRDRVERKKR